MPPEVTVVVPTHSRPAGLATLAESLRRQTLAPERFEVVVVDDGSDPPARVDAGGLDLRVVRHDTPRGPAAARNAGWRAGRAPLVAFIDDDCEATPGWLEAIAGAGAGGPELLVVQGPVEPTPSQRHELTPLSHTIEVGGPTRLFVSCNIVYSRPLLDATGGFDESFKKACGEDVELGLRALKAGAETRWSDGALVYHEVRQQDLPTLLRHTTKWTDSVRVLAMHPEIRGELLAGVFWKPTHPKLLLALVGLATRRPLLALPYLAHYRRDLRSLPTHLAVDLTEIGTALAGSIEHRTLML